MALRLKIQIEELRDPEVWRQLVVPETYTFHKLHKVIQVAFGWSGFREYEYPEKVSSTKLPLNDVFQKRGSILQYIYDLSDQWVHRIKFEEWVEENPPKPYCLNGEGACPPENCGGIWMYKKFKKMWEKDPHSEEILDLQKSLKIQIPDGWTPSAFDLNEINRRLNWM